MSNYVGIVMDKEANKENYSYYCSIKRNIGVGIVMMIIGNRNRINNEMEEGFHVQYEMVISVDFS